MSGSCVELNLKEVKVLQALFEKAKLSTAEKEQLLTNLSVEVEMQTLDRFDTKIDPEGKKWKPIADSTRKYLNKYFGGRETSLLVRTGDLRLSAGPPPEGDKPVFIGDDSIFIGSAMEYASYIQDGTYKMPARPMFGIGTGDYPALIKITTDFLAARLT